MLPEDRNWLHQGPDGAIRFDGALPGALLAGSFNPLHAGHRLLADVAGTRLGLTVHFELSVENVDKPSLSAEEAARRAQQFLGLAPLMVTRAPTFERKAALFPGTVFVVGGDTAERIVSSRYYAGDRSRVETTLDFIAGQGCRFLVAGRVASDGRFVTPAEIEIPERLRRLFEHVPDFRIDVSSTQIRANG